VMVKLNLNINIVIIMFGLFVAGTMTLAMRRHAANQREHDSLSLIGEHKH
jgi:MFS transporter, LPLT family, lysophospholipid transporter